MTDEIEKLYNQLMQYKYEYYILDAPTVPDSYYDREEHRLKKLLIAAGEDPETSKWMVGVGTAGVDEYLKRKNK